MQKSELAAKVQKKQTKTPNFYLILAAHWASEIQGTTEHTLAKVASMSLLYYIMSFL